MSSITHSRRQDHRDPGCSSLFPASLRLTVASGEDRNTFGVLPSCVPFRLAVGLTADTAAREASGHFYRLGTEVDLRIVLVQPGEPEYHALFAEAGDCKQNAFGMLFVDHDYVDNFADASGFIKCSVHVVNGDRLG